MIRETVFEIDKAATFLDLEPSIKSDCFPPRKPYGKDVGYVTSGPLSATLVGRNCGLGYVATADAAVGTALEVDIRGRRAKARACSLAMLPAPMIAMRISSINVAFLRSMGSARGGTMRAFALDRGLDALDAVPVHHAPARAVGGDAPGERGVRHARGHELRHRRAEFLLR